ncbi:MAG: YtxH domain-containing protein [Bacteroidota bacterium]|jgi:gas vesicle protein|nr:YtxH domain-containing protein [Bacteroidota bacterium]
MENSNNSGKIITSLLIGAAVGGILGILFAPHKGSKTRRLISGSTTDFTQSVKDKFNSMMDQAKGEVETIKDQVETIADKASRG